MRLSGAEARELRYDERMRRVIALSILFGVVSASCATEEQAGVCGGASAIHVWSGSARFPFSLGPRTLGGRPVVHTVTGTGETAILGTVIVEPCGAGTVIVDTERLLKPIEGLSVPDGPGTTMMCGMEASRPIVEIDLSGETAAKEVLEAWACPFATEHGAFAGRRATAAGDLQEFWWLPAFPDEAGAVQIPGKAFLVDFRRVGDTVFVNTADTYELHAFDLVTGIDTVVASGVMAFDTTESHVLWSGGKAALLEVETGTEIELVAEAGFAYWKFSPSGAYAIRTPMPTDLTTEDSLVTAYDLTGAQVVMPSTGSLQGVFPDDGLLILGGDRALKYGRIGQSWTTPLDYPPLWADDARILGDRLEVLDVAGDLWRVPLDGSPAIRMASGVGYLFEYLDDARLLTSFQGELRLFDVKKGELTVLAKNAWTFLVGPEGGVYYSVTGEDGAPDNGIWYLPPTALPQP